MNRSKKLFNISTLVYVCLVYLFLYLPIFVLVLFSFNSSKLNINFEGFTLKWYGELFSNGPLLEALKNTMIVAFFSTLVSGIIGTIAAVGMYRYSFKGKSVIDSLLYVPVVIPEIVLGISLLSFFSLIKIDLGLFSLVLAHATFSIPFVVITVRSRLSGFDKSIEEAAMDLGASRLKTFLKVTLPVIWPGVMSGVLLAFTLSLDDVIISFFTTGPQSNTLPLKIFSMVKTGVTPDVNALSTLMLVATFMVVGGAQYIQIRKEKSLNYNND
jgi:spermidine/putrescine transport system permease protein